ncbi:enoyl-CoA hydratase/isomerase family protein [Litorilinea aerophila]|uniref:Enoyl-CoA hydratase/isomerase family protein n=1 Tax=Litorilinea aerophila TaxID=1204385 RepID=A0A540VIV2_9CHLR|nr:enoyl-CoA hydratase/isomerase family protein [Litorilinea aerophila]MCC9075563.1 enoyl-CoA hydratase/isomerase family protein [Litorilinea aerophila]OUC05040.1 enoyl-CoA hydratase [Litorilinea aerophila]GIV79234.1 MAG: enoyl-CoA hydratase [Litorilinea sp.]
MSQDLVQFVVDGPVAILTLNRPEKLNALTPAMLQRLAELADRLEQHPDVRVAVLTGEGRAFCVGADIHAWAEASPLQMWREWTRMGHRVFARLADLPQPVLAALHGYAFGGGLELALAADLRLAAADCQLAFPEVRLGTIPGWGGTRRLPALVGPARAKELVLTGNPIDAARAAQWGLVNEVVDADRLLARTLELARSIAANAPIAVQASKQLIDNSGSEAMESLASGLTAFTQDLQEGLAAFRERRPPQFRGL